MLTHLRRSVSFVALALTLWGLAVQAQQPALPDILGIRPGMSPAEAYRVLKAHDPRGAIQYGQKQIPEISAKPITHALLYSPSGNGQGPEGIIVDLTFPPTQQTVWRVARALRFDPGKQPLPETLLTALRQKYGQEVPSTTRDVYYWVFDAQGRPVPRNAGINLTDCAMYVEQQNVFGSLDQARGPSSNPNVGAGVALNPTTVVANRDACHSFVYVGVTMGREGAVVSSISVTVTDMGMGIRAGTATQAAIKNYAVAQQQRALQHAQQQAAPTF